MTFTELTIEEFKEFSKNHPQASFMQTLNWGELKKENGWNPIIVGVKEDNKVIAASLILSKEIFLGKKMFYAPRGFLIDYSNKELLSFFTKKIKEYAKRRKAIFIKIDPYVSYQEIDLEG